MAEGIFSALGAIFLFLSYGLVLGFLRLRCWLTNGHDFVFTRLDYPSTVVATCRHCRKPEILDNVVSIRRRR